MTTASPPKDEIDIESKLFILLRYFLHIKNFPLSSFASNDCNIGYYMYDTLMIDFYIH